MELWIIQHSMFSDDKIFICGKSLGNSEDAWNAMTSHSVAYMKTSRNLEKDLCLGIECLREDQNWIVVDESLAHSMRIGQRFKSVTLLLPEELTWIFNPLRNSQLEENVIYTKVNYWVNFEKELSLKQSFPSMQVLSICHLKSNYSSFLSSFFFGREVAD